MRSFYKTQSLRVLCDLLGFSRQAYYARMRDLESDRFERSVLLSLVNEVRLEQPRLGGRKLFFMLQAGFSLHGLHIGRDKFFDFLRQEGLAIRPTHKRTQTTQSHHWLRKYPYLCRDWAPSVAEQLWVSDITYLRAGDRFVYLILILDAYSRRIMGWQLSPTLEAAFCVEALQSALGAREFPERRLMHHSDRGVQYCSEVYTTLLQKHQVQISMTQSGSPYDNAQAERINGILKGEFLLDQTFADFQAAKQKVATSIQVYNEKRPHSSCNYLTPQQAHQQRGELQKRW